MRVAGAAANPEPSQKEKQPPTERQLPTEMSAGAADGVLEKGSVVLYEDKQSGKVLEVTVMKVHYDDTPPYYSIRLPSGQERETVRERLWRKGDRTGTWQQARAAPLPVPYLSEPRLQHHAPVP